jgi:hypothetical protein
MIVAVDGSLFRQFRSGWSLCLNTQNEKFVMRDKAARNKETQQEIQILEECGNQIEG